MPQETEAQKLKRLENAAADLKNKKGGGDKSKLNAKGSKAKDKVAAAMEGQKKKKAEKKAAEKEKKAAAKEAAKAAKAEKKAAAEKEKAEKKAAKEKERAEKKAAKDKEKADKIALKQAEKEKAEAMRDKPVMTLATAPNINALDEDVKKYVKFTPSGLVIGKDAPFDAWEKLGAFLLGIEERWQFYIGDWLLFGEAKYGEMYTQAINVFSKGYSTLANAKMVCQKFGPEARKANVDFSIFLTLSRVQDDAKRLALVDQAAKENWTVKEARVKSERAMPKKRAKGRGVPKAESEAQAPSMNLTEEDQKNFENAVEKSDEVLTFLNSRAFAKLPASAKNQLGKVLQQIVKFYQKLY